MNDEVSLLQSKRLTIGCYVLISNISCGSALQRSSLQGTTEMSVELIKPGYLLKLECLLVSKQGLSDYNSLYKISTNNDFKFYHWFEQNFYAVVSSKYSKFNITRKQELKYIIRVWISQKPCHIFIILDKILLSCL